MTKFRPCIDLHQGQVKQIVGGTLTTKAGDLKENHVSPHSASYFAKLYQDNRLEGAHMIMLGPGCGEVAKTALVNYPGVLQLGGGINDRNAAEWIEWGASKVSCLLCRTEAVNSLLPSGFINLLPFLTSRNHNMNFILHRLC